MTRQVVPLARNLWPLALALTLAPACSGKRVTLPEFHGRVVDARTGAPIAGAIIKRRLYQAGPISIGDGSRPLGVEGSEVVTHSNADGRFVLPSFGARTYTGMGWLVYRPGWMPIYGCYSEEGWAFGGCSGFGAPGNDPWTSATFSKSGDVVTFEVRVFPPTLEGVTFRSYNVYTKEWVTYTPTPEESDPWGNYFERLRDLTTLRCLERHLVLTEGVSFLMARHAMTDRVAVVFFEMTGAPIKERPTRRDQDPEVVQLRGALVRYCDEAPTNAFCSRYAVGLNYIRDFLREGAGSAR